MQDGRSTVGTDTRYVCPAETAESQPLPSLLSLPRKPVGRDHQLPACLPVQSLTGDHRQNLKQSISAARRVCAVLYCAPFANFRP